MSRQAELDQAAHERRDQLVSALIDWVRIPSISGVPAHAPDVRRSAEHLRDRARGAGMTRAEIWETAGHPAVFAERIEDPQLPTVLVYGHHDVQPVDPLAEWRSPPFEPVVSGGELRGRGVSDDKQHLLMHLEAVATLLQVEGRLPINLKLIAEGEEESGSPHFEELVRAHREALAADVVVISDTGMLGPEEPALTIGLRGLAYWEVRVVGPAADLHSGIFGGAVANPITVLCALLAGLHDPQGGVAVPGFYDAVRPLRAAERAAMAAIPFDLAGFQAAAGVPALTGEAGWSTVERRSVRPTLDPCGIWGGYQGAGPKTIIPARASAKLSARLVPDQDPAAITDLVREHLLRAAPPGVVVEVEALQHGAWVLTDPDHPAVRAAAQAVAEVWGKPPALIREGGSIPPVATLAAELGAPCVLFGVILPDDRIHAPNERLVLEQLFRGVRATTRIWHRYGALGRAGLSAPAVSPVPAPPR